MSLIPFDVAPFLKFGLVGILCAIILLMLIFGIKVMPLIIARITPTNGNGKASVDRFALQQAQSQLDAIKAGSQPVQFWLNAYDVSNEKAARPILESLGRIRARGKQLEEQIAAHELQTKENFETLRRDIAALAEEATIQQAK